MSNKTTKYSYFIKNKKTGNFESFTGLFETLHQAHLWRDTHGQWFVNNRNHEFKLAEHLVLKTAVEPTHHLIPA